MSATKMIPRFVALVGTVAVTDAVALPAYGSTPESSDARDRLPSTTRVEVPFDSPQRLVDAARSVEFAGYEISAYRFENAEIVGEFSPAGNVSVDEYVDTFVSDYGTEPQIVSAVIEVPLDVAERIHNGAKEEWSKYSIDALGPQSIFIFITAPGGNDGVGKVSGTVQAVSEDYCEFIQVLSNTDCMNVWPSSSGERVTLGLQRNWYAPPLCWESLSYGEVSSNTYLLLC